MVGTVNECCRLRALPSASSTICKLYHLRVLPSASSTVCELCCLRESWFDFNKWHHLYLFHFKMKAQFSSLHLTHRDNYWSFFWNTSVLSLDTQEVCLYPATLTSISVPLYFNKSLHVLNTFYNYGLLGHKELFSVCVIFLMIVYGRPLSTILIWNDAMRIQLLVDIFLGVDWTILNHVFIISLLRFITCLLVTLQQILLEIFLLG